MKVDCHYFIKLEVRYHLSKVNELKITTCSYLMYESDLEYLDWLEEHYQQITPFTNSEWVSAEDVILYNNLGEETLLEVEKLNLRNFYFPGLYIPIVWKNNWIDLLLMKLHKLPIYILPRISFLLVKSQIHFPLIEEIKQDSKLLYIAREWISASDALIRIKKD